MNCICCSIHFIILFAYFYGQFVVIYCDFTSLKRPFPQLITLPGPDKLCQALNNRNKESSDCSNKNHYLVWLSFESSISNGFNLKEYKKFTRSNCRIECQKHKKCIGFLFHNKTSECFLKYQINKNLTRKNGEAMEYLACCNKSLFNVKLAQTNETCRMLEKRSDSCNNKEELSWFEGRNLDSTFNDFSPSYKNIANEEICRQKCLETANCWGVSYVAKIKECFVKYKKSTIFPKNGVELFVLSCCRRVTTDCFNGNEIYRGNKSTSITRKSCVPWAELGKTIRKGPHYMDLENQMFPDGTILSAANYCRAIDHDSLGPWCIIDKKTGRYEYCFSKSC